MLKFIPLIAGGFTLLLASFFPLPTNTCRAEVRPINHSAPLGQELISVTVPSTCPLTSHAVLRFRTAQGAVLPMIGYFVLRGSYPRERRLWLIARSPDGGTASVEQRFADGWHPIWRVGQ